MAAPIGPEPRNQNREFQSKDFDDVPLFMQNLPDDPENSVALAALQSLQQEDTPDELGDRMKRQGNDYFKQKRFREALGLYSKGVDAKPTDVKLLEALLINRAACNLELRNFGSVIRDCARALKLNPQCSKAFFRSASACTTLERFDEAIDCCERCLKFDPNNAGVVGALKRAREAQAAKNEKIRARDERLDAQKKSIAHMANAFKERGIIVIPNPDVSQNPYEPKFDPEDPTKSTLMLTVFLLYPQYATSDVISEYIENVPFQMHLDKMLPPKGARPDWDKKGEYTVKNVNIYAMTAKKKLFKVGKNKTLREAFEAGKSKEGEPKDGVELRDGCLTFVVVPRGEIENQWISEFKSTR